MMARFLVAATAVVLLAGGVMARDDKKKDDTDMLQGDWQVTSMEIAGNKVAEEQTKAMKLTVKGSDWSPTAGGGRKFTFKLDATKTPKELDLLFKMDGKEQTWRGIYKLDGDTLTFCRSQVPDGDRPKEFKSTQGVALIVYKRAGK